MTQKHVNDLLDFPSFLTVICLGGGGVIHLTYKQFHMDGYIRTNVHMGTQVSLQITESYM